MCYILMLTMCRGIVSVTVFSFNHLLWFSLLPSFGFVLWTISCLLDFSLAPSMPWTAFGLFLHHWWGLNSLSLYPEAMILTTALPMWFLLTVFSCKLLSERLEVRVQEPGKTLTIPILGSNQGPPACQRYIISTALSWLNKCLFSCTISSED